MNNLKRLLTTPLGQVPTSIIVVLFLLALVGFADATYLTVEHFKGVIPPCSLTQGCDTVLTSNYSVILGIPTALLGSIYYFVIMVGFLAYFETKNSRILKWTALMTILGLIFSLWLTSLQVFVIESYCLYCLISAGISTIIFGLSMYILAKYKTNNELAN